MYDLIFYSSFIDLLLTLHDELFFKENKSFFREEYENLSFTQSSTRALNSFLAAVLPESGSRIQTFDNLNQLKLHCLIPICSLILVSLFYSRTGTQCVLSARCTDRIFIFCPFHTGLVRDILYYEPALGLSQTTKCSYEWIIILKPSITNVTFLN